MDASGEYGGPLSVAVEGGHCPGLATYSIFFCFLFVKKIIDLPGGQINDPLSGKTLFSVVPEATHEPETRELLGGTEENSVSPMRGH